MDVDCHQLQEALKAHGRSTNDLATSLGEKQQTLQLIVSGTTRRCRRSRRDAIANELEVPPDFLSGELRELPFVTLLTYLQRRMRSSGEGEAQGQDEFELPTVGRIVLSSHAQRCFDALRRDFPDAFPANVEKETRTGYELLGLVLDSRRGGGARLLLRLAGLLNPHRWQEQLLLAGTDEDEPQLSEEEVEQAVKAFAHAFKIVLRPWFEGRCRLDIEGLLGASEQAAAKSEEAVLREIGAQGDP